MILRSRKFPGFLWENGIRNPLGGIRLLSSGVQHISFFFADGAHCAGSGLTPDEEHNRPMWRIFPTRALLETDYKLLPVKKEDYVKGL